MVVRDRLTIGGLAQQAGVHVETIRYYERRGLLVQPSKPPGGQRRYGAAAVIRVRFVRRAQQLGFTLEEVKTLLVTEDSQTCRKARLLAENKLAVVEQHIRDLSRMRRQLKGLVAQCTAERPQPKCPIVATLEQESV